MRIIFIIKVIIMHLPAFLQRVLCYTKKDKMNEPSSNTNQTLFYSCNFIYHITKRCYPQRSLLLFRIVFIRHTKSHKILDKLHRIFFCSQDNRKRVPFLSMNWNKMKKWNWKCALRVDVLCRKGSCIGSMYTGIFSRFMFFYTRRNLS